MYFRCKKVTPSFNPAPLAVGLPIISLEWAKVHFPWILDIPCWILDIFIAVFQVLIVTDSNDKQSLSFIGLKDHQVTAIRLHFDRHHHGRTDSFALVGSLALARRVKIDAGLVR